MTQALTLYGIPNCDTVKRARAWLAGQGAAGTDFEAAWAVERLATAIRMAAGEERWVKVNEV